MAFSYFVVVLLIGLVLILTLTEGRPAPKVGAATATRA